LTAYLNLPELAGRRYIHWDFEQELPLSEKKVAELIEKWEEKKESFALGIILRESQALIGHVEADWHWDPICPGVSIVISPSYQRQGYGSETLKIVLNYLFNQLLAHNVSAWTADWNEAGIAFLNKNGFTKSGVSRREGIRNGKYYDEFLFDILRPEWLKKFGG
jgi:RimJ/RimL family protein N-acetyltransferase